VEADLPGVRPFFLKLGELFGHLGEGFIEDRNLVFEAEAHFGVLIERLVPRIVEIGGFERDRLVAILLGELDAAVPVTMLYVAAPDVGKNRR
jgi:hypothetical protein